MSNLGIGARGDYRTAFGGLVLGSDFVPSALVIAGITLCFITLAYEFFGAWTSSGIGQKQQLALALGGAITLAGVGLKFATRPESRGELMQFWGIAFQLLLLGIVIATYQLENRAFFEFVFPLMVAGFIIHHHLAPELRKPFFFFLGMVAFVGVFWSNVVGAIWLIGLALALFVIANLPIALWIRVCLLAAAGLVFAAMRVGWFETSWSGLVVPILSAMFIFRMVIYLYDREAGKGPKNIWQRLSYFFLPPNVVFPFFPVVDFATFGRTYYNEDALRIYQRGAGLILRGLIHLLVYRIIYLYGVMAPENVENAGDFLRFITMNFGLYLKISGLFHIISGTILLFGYNLPETHRRFYFANSFIDFWRRINIYWKDFMQKIVFTPTFIRLNRMGPSDQTCIVLSIFAVFFATWALHAYQWFWLRGTLLLTATDMLFWLVLGCLLVFQTLYEGRAKDSGGTPAAPLLGPQVSLVVRTLCTFLTICLLWSFWTSESPEVWGRLWLDSGLLPAFNPDAPAGALDWVQSIVVTLLVVAMIAVTAGVGFGVLNMAAAPKRATGASKRSLTAPLVGGAISLALLFIQSPAFDPAQGSWSQGFLRDLRMPRLNAQDQALLRRGYYEDLTNVGRFNSQLWELYASRPQASSDLRQSDVTRPRDDAVVFEFVPNTSVSANGVTYKINSWGTRDYEFPKKKPEGAVRLAFTGASPVAGWGVELEDRFDTQLVKSLNAKNTEVRLDSFNLAVDGHQLVDRVVLFDARAWEFKPDIMVYFAHSSEGDMVNLATAYLNGSMPEDGFMADAFKRAGVKRSMKQAEVELRLGKQREQVIGDMYRHLAQQALRHGVRPAWAYLPLVSENPVDTELLTRLAQEAGFTVIDFKDIFDGHEHAKLQLEPWDTHPNAMGHKLMATRLEEGLRSLLAPLYSLQHPKDPVKN